jgi:hypothetical protein
MRRVMIVAVVAGVAVLVAGVSAASASAATVPVFRCATTFGFPPGAIHLPRRLTVLGSDSSDAGLTAYTNTRQYLIGPSGLQCQAILAADQTAQILLWTNPHAGPPRIHAHVPGLSLEYDPDCTSCQAGLACPFFGAFARSLDLPCRGGALPATERDERHGANLVLFQDPPGVAGSGDPSGGPDPANGVVGIHGRSGAVFRASCTLPASRHAACTTTLDDVIARYG